jgi:hypothetical protein
MSLSTDIAVEASAAIDLMPNHLEELHRFFFAEVEDIDVAEDSVFGCLSCS